MEGKAGPSHNNAGFPLQLAVDAMAAEVNLPATQQYFAARTPTTIAHVKDKWLAAWLMRAVSCCFQRDDGDLSIRALCASARQPLPADLTGSWDLPADMALHCYGVWVKPHSVNEASQLLSGTGLRVGTLASTQGGNPAPMRERLSQIEAAATQGADDIEVDASNELCHAAIWHELYEEVRAMKEAAGAANLGVRLPVELLGTLTNIHRAATVCMLAGADCITLRHVAAGTGEYVARGCDTAVFEVGLVVLRAILAYSELSGIRVAFKPPEVDDANSAVTWMALVRDVMGELWTRPGLLHLSGQPLEDMIGHLRSDSSD